MAALLSELHLTLRLSQRNPAAFTSSLLSLILGIGANIAVFSVINAALLRPLPYIEPERIVVVLESYPSEGVDFAGFSYENYLDWEGPSKAFSHTAAVSTSRPLTLTGVDRPRRLPSQFVSAGYLPLLGVQPLIGRGFSLQEADVEGTGPVALISYRLWQDLFGAEQSVLGSELHLNGQAFEVVGVLPAFFRGVFWDPIDVWVPIGMAGRLLGERYLVDRDIGWHLALARLGPDQTISTARSEMAVLSTALEADHPASNRGLRIALHPLRDYYYRRELRDRLVLLAVASALVLALCTSNLIGLALAQCQARRRELATRTALGAGRRHVVQLLGAYWIPTSLLGGLLAVVCAWAATPALVRMSDLRPATFDERYVDLNVLAVGAALAIGTAAVSALIAALLTLRSLQVGDLKDTTSIRSATAPRSRGTLVVLEVALALILLSSTAAVSLAYYERVASDLGVEARNLLAIELGLPAGGNSDEHLISFADRLVDEAVSIADVDLAAVAGPLLAPFASLSVDVTSEQQSRNGQEDQRVLSYLHSIDVGAPETLGIPLLRGRSFTELDDAEHPAVAIVSSSLAARVWPEDEPLGQRIRLTPARVDDTWTTIVGVVADVQHRPAAVGAIEDRDLYLPYKQAPVHNFFLLLRSRAEPQLLLDRLRERIRTLDPDLPVDRIETMSARLRLAAADTRFTAVLIAAFSAIALGLALVGIYGIVSLYFAEHRRDLGLRLALGATRADLHRLVLGRALRLLAPGIALGLLGSLALRPILASVVGELSALEPLLLAGAAAVLLLAALAPAFVPARRALKVDPAQVLRQE